MKLTAQFVQWPLRGLACALALLFAVPSLAQPVRPPRPLAEASPNAASPALTAIHSEIRAGRFSEALAAADAFLKSETKNPVARFLRGVALTELKRDNEAISAFQSLTEDFPEIAEPYNNMAVLFAGKGEYDKARAALELAIHNHPNYDTAHENLGDVYVKLASLAYAKAAKNERASAPVHQKLKLARDLIALK